jgi:NitT/TauT family transport system substrate-binding protein
MSKRYFVLCAAVALTVTPGRAQEAAEIDILRVVVDQPGIWSASAPAIGQKAGFFRKHGLALDLVDASSLGRPTHAVASSSADLAIGVGTAAVLRAY